MDGARKNHTRRVDPPPCGQPRLRQASSGTMGESFRALILVHAAPAEHPRGFCRVPVGLHYRPPRARGSNRQPKQAAFFSSLLPGPLPPNRRSARFSRGFCAVPSAWLETMKDRAQHRPPQDHRRRAVWRWDSCRTRRPGCGSNRRFRPGLLGFFGGEVRDPTNRLPTPTPPESSLDAGPGTARGASRRAIPKRDWLSSKYQVIRVTKGADRK